MTPRGTATTRRMISADLDGVVRLEEEIFSDPWPRSAFQREVLGDEAAWPRVAIDPGTGEVQGYMVAWFVADEVHLANVAVAEEARRRGIAQSLLDELSAEGFRRGARVILLEVRRSNLGAQAFYRKNGFYQMDVRRGYYRDKEDALVMAKPLTEAGRIPPHPRRTV
jgi:[ribosomal protein S18]-alanine N-acetyltransferase